MASSFKSFLSGLYDEFASGPRALGNAVGTALVSPWENKRLQQELRNAELLADTGRLRQQRGLDGSQYFNSAQRLTQNVANQQRGLGQRQQQAEKDAVTGGFRTGFTVLGAGAGGKAIGATAALGGALGGGINYATGGNVAEGIGRGIGGSLKYAGLNRLTSPIIDPLVASSGRIAGSALGPLAKYGARGIAHGGLNVLEDQMFTRATEGRAPTGAENLTSFAIGALTSPLVKYDPDNSFLQIVDGKLSTDPKRYRDALGRYAKAEDISISEAKARVDKWIGQQNEPTTIRIMKGDQLVEEVVPRWRAKVQEQPMGMSIKNVREGIVEPTKGDMGGGDNLKIQEPDNIDIVDNKVVNPTLDRVKKAIENARPLREAQERIYSAERGRRLGEVKKVKTPGEAGFSEQKQALGGALPRVQFESIRNEIGQDGIDEMYNMVRDSGLRDWDKISAQAGLSKLFNDAGGEIPTQGELKLLREVFGQDLVDSIVSKKSGLQKAGEGLFQIASTPRSLMASFDLSAPLRQGVFFISRPKQWIPAFKNMFKQFASEDAFVKSYQDIASRPTFETMKDSNLAIIEPDASLTAREEQFMSDLAERIPVIGRGVRASNRAYTGFLNQLRADVFDDILSNAEKSGVPVDAGIQKQLAEFVNNATGRGRLPDSMEGSVKLLSSAFFSPRLIASRVNLLNPVYYARLNPVVRKEALKSLFGFAATGLTVLGLAKLGGADVETDPRNSDFGKIKFGNTRYDIWGGFQQYIKLAARLITGEGVSSTTGEEYDTNRAEELGKFFTYKEAPIISFAHDLLRGKTAIGEDITAAGQVERFTVPLVIQDMKDLIKENGLPGIAMGAPAMFGVGVQTYGPKQQIKIKEKPGILTKLIGAKASDGQVQTTGLSIDDRDELIDQIKSAMKQGDEIQNVPPTNFTMDGVDYNGYVVEDRFIYQDEFGDIKTKSVTSIEKQLLKDSKALTNSEYNLQADRLKRADDVEGWIGLTSGYIDYLKDYKKKLDKKKDKKEIVDVQNKIEDLQASLDKYSGYGGFSKPKKGKKVSFKAPKAKASTVKLGKVSGGFKLSPLKITPFKPGSIKIDDAEMRKALQVNTQIKQPLKLQKKFTKIKA